jgi:hypothetical protein
MDQRSTLIFVVQSLESQHLVFFMEKGGTFRGGTQHACVCSATIQFAILSPFMHHPSELKRQHCPCNNFQTIPFVTEPSDN